MHVARNSDFGGIAPPFLDLALGVGEGKKIRLWGDSPTAIHNITLNFVIFTYICII